jgi:1-acyl-sn-glycerol-3-phosphate acyltransferase
MGVYTMIIKIRAVWRWLRLIWHVMLGLSLTLLLTGLFRRSSTSPVFQRAKQWWLSKVVRIIGGQLQVKGTVTTGAKLIVANHVSWLDIPVLGAVLNPSFLSKAEVQHWPLIGWLATQAGTLYITRGQAGAANQAANTITQALQQHQSVLLFPEGTTSDGQDVKTFHARLFAPALDANVPVQPIAIRYKTRNGELSTVVPYIGEQSLLQNLQALLREPTITIEVHCLEPINTTGLARKSLAHTCEQAIRAIVATDSSALLSATF